MKTHEIRVLKILESVKGDRLSSQRDLARELNISLGLVNSFIKRLAHKGYVKPRPSRPGGSATSSHLRGWSKKPAHLPLYPVLLPVLPPSPPKAKIPFFNARTVRRAQGCFLRHHRSSRDSIFIAAGNDHRACRRGGRPAQRQKVARTLGYRPP